MSMNTSVYGIKPPDEKWKKMKQAWEACQKAGVEAPEEVRKFFNYEEPDKKGVVVDLEIEVDTSVEMQEVWEVELDKLPKDVKIIRFVNSY